MSGVEWGKIRRKPDVADTTYGDQRITYHDRTPFSAALPQTAGRRKPYPEIWAAALYYPAL